MERIRYFDFLVFDEEFKRVGYVRVETVGLGILRYLLKGVFDFSGKRAISKVFFCKKRIGDLNCYFMCWKFRGKSYLKCVGK